MSRWDRKDTYTATREAMDAQRKQALSPLGRPYPAGSGNG